MTVRLAATFLLLAYGPSGLAAEIKGRVTDEQGSTLKGVRVCLSAPDAAPGDCAKTRVTNKNGDYAFKGLDSGEYVVRVLAGASLSARKADPYSNLAWSPVSRSLTVTSRSQKIAEADFTGVFNFSNFQAEIQLTGSDFPELASYDVANDYVFLKLYTTDEGSGEQNLIFLGQVTDISRVLVEVSVPLSVGVLYYEVYSADAPQPVLNSIDLTV